MPSLKSIRTRIASVKNTQKITKAMKMVAASKLRRAQEAVISTRPYAEKLVEVIEHLAERVDHERHPLLRESAQPKRAAIIAMSGDRGLCGAYNTNINKRVLRFYKEKANDYDELEIHVIGRKGRDFLRHRKVPIAGYEADSWKQPAHLVAKKLADGLCERFENGELDELYVAYTKFHSAIAQTVVLDRVLPLRNVPEQSEDAAYATLVEYIYEPSADELLQVLLPRAVMTQIQRAMLESAASEHGARMTAMDNATSNAGEMIANLTLQYNRARQAAITKELIEIVSGAEAL